jgi:hypothetical protein
MTTPWAVRCVMEVPHLLPIGSHSETTRVGPSQGDVSKGDTRAVADRDHLATRHCHATQIDRGRRSPGRPLVLLRPGRLPCRVVHARRSVYTAWMPRYGVDAAFVSLELLDAALLMGRGRAHVQENRTQVAPAPSASRSGCAGPDGTP